MVGSFQIHLPISDLRKDPKTSRLILVFIDAVFGGVQFWGSILSISGHPGWHPMDCFFHFIYWKEKAWWETSNPLVEMETLTGTKHKILQFWCSFPLLSIVTCLLHWRFVSVILGPKQWVCELKQNVTVVISKEIQKSHEGSTTTNVVGKSFTLHWEWESCSEPEEGIPFRGW